jgi:uncharacterized protein
MKKVNRKTLRYYYLKLVKHSGSPESVSRGVAVGFFIGFLIPFGLQMAIALPLAFIVKARKIPALACTWVTNPYTIPFIYPIQCYIGSITLGKPLSLVKIKNIFSNFFDACSKLDGGFIANFKGTIDALLNLGGDILIPFLVGGLLFGIISAFLGYFTSFGLIIRHNKKKKEKLAKRLSVLASRKED